jgi:pyruvate/2-oxoglutarate dehydrogenase complex dihydrolipoamide acyltransferase (E2) component
VDVFFQVANDLKGNDLSGAVIRNANQKSLVTIAEEIQEQVEKIRKKGDPRFKKMKNTVGFVPSFLIAQAVNFLSFILYSLNLWSPLLGSPRDAFGSLMVSNVGTIGLDHIFAPLVPYSRVPFLLTIGTIKETPVVKNGKIDIAPIAQLGITSDHRLIDGIHGGYMLKALREIFENPEQLSTDQKKVILNAQ